MGLPRPGSPFVLLASQFPRRVRVTPPTSLLKGEGQVQQVFDPGFDAVWQYTNPHPS